MFVQCGDVDDIRAPDPAPGSPATCPICSGAVPDAALFCPFCGAAQGQDWLATRIGARGDDGQVLATSFESARFQPGRVFAGRYRIVSLLGRGGMGEVYRADDLKLGQRVALKLLAANGEVRDDLVQRFIAEVRNAREIAHPNVCRVYDIGEADGWHYLSMEYVDGETLRSLLRRIGRLPSGKTLDVARQICAGLAAAHERGILHRDLKPANIMIDGRGQVRIVDLGLAAPIGDTSDEVVGTPAYMAPEQLTRGRVSERTDLFALGAILYELFTGEPLFTAATVLQRAAAGPADPSALHRTGGIDSGVHEAITRCLERDPANRPSSAWAVAALLPGGDPLAAAIAEGRMPSPEMVAASGQRGVLAQSAALALAATIAIGTLTIAWHIGHVTQTAEADLPKPPEVLAERARSVLELVGHRATVRDRDYWFEPDRGAIRFVYRQSPAYLISQNSMHAVMIGDPPTTEPGMATVVLDTSGRLRQLQLVPDAAAMQTPGSPPRWQDLVADAGLDWNQLSPAATPHVPLAPHDTRVSWEAPHVRVTGASLNNRIVFFEVADPESPPRPAQTWFSRGARSPINEALLVLFAVALFTGGGVLARRNVRLGYGDTNGARRLATFIAIAGVVSGVLRAHHAPQPVDEWIFLLIVTGWSLVWAGFAWLMYLSLEPYMRKWWPHTLVAWSRLLAGRVRDPLVGRDVLAGVVAGMVFVGLLVARADIARAMGASIQPWDQAYALEGLRSPRYFFGLATYFSLDTMNFALGALSVLLLLRVVARNPWISCAAWMAIIASLNAGGGPVAVDAAISIAIAGLALFVLLRFGLVSTAAMLLYTDFMTRLPVTLDANSWYLGSAVLTLSIVAALTAYGLIVAVADS
jgi:Protein kinase domain